MYGAVYVHFVLDMITRGVLEAQVKLKLPSFVNFTLFSSPVQIEIETFRMSFGGGNAQIRRAQIFFRTGYSKLPPPQGLPLFLLGNTTGVLIEGGVLGKFFQRIYYTKFFKCFFEFFS